MKLFKKVLCGCLSAAFIFTSLAVTPAASKTEPKLNKAKATLEVGEKLTLKVKNTKDTIKWSSSDKNVAAVSKKGVVTAKAEGNATIKAIVSKKTLKCKITVKETAAQGTDISDQLAGRSYKGTATIPMVGELEVLSLKFGEDGTVSGSKLDESDLVSMKMVEFTGTYKAVLNGKTVNVTVTADGKTFSYPLTIASTDMKQLTANVGGFDISVNEVEE